MLRAVAGKVRMDMGQERIYLLLQCRYRCLQCHDTVLYRWRLALAGSPNQVDRLNVRSTRCMIKDFDFINEARPSQPILTGRSFWINVPLCGVSLITPLGLMTSSPSK